MATQSRPGPSRARADAPKDVQFDYIRLAAQLTLEDIDELDADTARGRGATLSDAELALQFLARDARASMLIDQDRAYARSLQEDLIQNDVWEARGVPNRRAHLDLQNQNPNPNDPNPRIQVAQPARPTAQGEAEPPSVFGWAYKAFSWFVSPTSKGENVKGSTSTQRLTGHNCVICQDPIRGAEVRAPCNHYYDKGCIAELFEAATRDESLFPPRCCRHPIPLASVRIHLTAELISLFNEKTVEFGTLKRIYCANPKCSRFLGPRYEGWFSPKRVTCPSCFKLTCTGCKAEVSLTGHSCNAANEKEREVLALGNTEGWARCPGCSQMIELSVGCYHMTCRCKTEFCYLCKARWKTCACTQWDERRLLEAAEARVNVRLGAVHPPEPPARRRPVPEPPVRAPPLRAERQHPAVATVAPARPARAATEQVGGHGSVRDWASIHRPSTENERNTTNRHASADVTTTAFANAIAVPSAGRHATLSLDYDAIHRRSTSSNAVRAHTWNSISAESTASRATRPPKAPTKLEEGHSGSSQVTNNSRSSSSRADTNRNTRVNVPQTHSTTSSTNRNLAAISESSRARLIREAVEQLRVNHDCDHTKWKYRAGGGKCETCHFVLPCYLFRCSNCQMLVCNRCRRNRL